MSFTAAEQSRLPRDFALLRSYTKDATQHLLGNTISLTDDEWQSLSLAPGWTRAHLATHLSMNAEAFARVITSQLAGTSEVMYPSRKERLAKIERGSEREGMALQIQLDASADQFTAALDTAEERLDPATVIQVSPTSSIRFDMVPLARLNEVLLHHVDLNIGFKIGEIDDTLARFLLEWNVYLLTNAAGYPRIELQSDSGFRARFGSHGTPLPVTGSDRLLLGWITGRIESSHFDASLPWLPVSN